MAETNSNKTVTLNEKFARSDLWFHPGEELAEGEMRVTLMGTGWGSMIRPNQKGASIYIELGIGGDVEKKIEAFVFDVGPGCGINYNVMGIPFSRMDKIFLTRFS